MHYHAHFEKSKGIAEFVIAPNHMALSKDDLNMQHVSIL